MKSFSWSFPALLAAAFAAGACGSDESKPTGASGTGGDTSAGGSPSVDAGSGGAVEAGGAPTSGGAPSVDAGPPPDVVAPVFGGITGITGVGEDRASVTWNAATDDATPAERIAYRVYRSITSGGQDFGRARRCGLAIQDASPTEQASLPCYSSSAAGATSAVVIDALPAQQFFYVVRAVDASGNEDTNTTELGLSTADATGPDFGGVNGARVLSATSIEVDWGAGYDLAAPDSLLTFQVFVHADGDPAPTQPAYSSAPGEHRAVISGLRPRTTYSVWARAVDPSTNPGGGEGYRITITTPEGIAPTFDGVIRADATERSVLLLWPSAIDNASATPSIVYDIWSSQTDAVSARDLAGPPRITSPAGATSIRLLEPEENTRYSYVVRARDVAGNRDANTKQVSIVTGARDTTAPVFAGASTVAAATPTSLRITWTPANDAATTQAEFTYRIFVSTTSPVPTTTPALVVHGGSSAVLGGLVPDTAYRVVIRAVDRAGNVDEAAPPVERGASTPARVGADITPPVLGGAHSAANRSSPSNDAQPRRLYVTWPTATDSAPITPVPDAGAGDAGDAGDAGAPEPPSGQVRYHVCVSTTAAGCQGAAFFSNVAATTAVGAVTATVDSLAPRTAYFVGLRAEDANGNVSSSGTLVQATTATSWSMNVFPLIAERCFACHTVFDKLSNIQNVKGALFDETACPTPNTPGVDGCQLDLVEPGYPEYSILFRKVNPQGLSLPPFQTIQNRYDGLLMPSDSTGSLNAEEIDMLRDWITEGAAGN